jgi:hypothetical protein
VGVSVTAVGTSEGDGVGFDDSAGFRVEVGIGVSRGATKVGFNDLTGVGGFDGANDGVNEGKSEGLDEGDNVPVGGSVGLDEGNVGDP